MIKVHQGGAYLIQGREIVCDNQDAKAAIKSKTGKEVTIEEAKKETISYGILENHLWVYHKEFEHAYEYNFYKERADKKLKTFVKVTDYKESVLKSNIINFVAFDEYEIIKSIAEEISKIDGINVNYYRDVYEETGKD